MEKIGGEDLTFFFSPKKKDVFGGGFTGVQCSVDEDCAFSKCDRKWGRCALPSAQEVEDVYLQCYIDNMPSFTEVIREQKFTSSLSLFSSSSSFLL